MKQWKYLLVSCCALGLATSCGPQLPKEVPTARVTVRVVDDDGQPVAEAKVAVVGFYNAVGKGKTDGKGCCTVTLRNASGGVDLEVDKEGFYSIYRRSYNFTDHTNGQWMPWNPTVELQLHKKSKPVPLVVKSVRGLPIPVKGQPVGYDLIGGDWVAPYGKGQTDDFVFFAESTISNKDNFSSHLRLTFSNPGDGLILRRLFWRDDYEMRLAALAPVEGYSNQWDFVLNAKLNPATERREVISTATDDDNYYFRVRTKQDEKGNVVSAIYGKIYYGISFDPGFWHEGRPGISFMYYLNPDGTRNLEFDTHSNLCADPGTISKDR